jgi:hypothetical protein
MLNNQGTLFNIKFHECFIKAEVLTALTVKNMGRIVR